DEGASGATVTPARRLPRNTVAYSSEVCLGGRRGGQRRDRDSCAQAAQEHRGVLQRGAGANGNGIARSHSVPLQRGRHPVHQRIQFAIAEGAVVEPQGRCLRLLARGGADQVGNGGERLFKEGGNAHGASGSEKLLIGCCGSGRFTASGRRSASAAGRGWAIKA